MFNLLCKYNVKGLYFGRNFHHFLLYSTSSKVVNQCFADYLVNHLGFSHKQALATSTKLVTKKVNDFKSCDKANSVVLFFKQHGFDDTHIRKIVSLYPRILRCNVNNTLKPKFKLLQDEGFSASDLIRVISTNPLFVSGRQMNDIISTLRTVLGSDENLVKFLKKPNNFTTTASLKYLRSNVALLKNDYGVAIEVIRNNLVKTYGSFLRNPEFFQNVVTRVEEELKIPRHSSMFLYGINLLSLYSKKNIESKCQVYKSFGWTDAQISDLIRRNPCSFSVSEELLRKKLGFLMSELGYQPDFFSSRSSFFTYSLEKRIVPRYRVLLILKEKGLLDYYNFYSAIQMTETKFLEIVAPFKKEIPDLLEIYENSKGCLNTASLST